MKKYLRVLVTFIVSLVVCYIIIGYIRYSQLIPIDNMGGNTFWMDIRDTYITEFPINIVPALITAIIPSIIVLVMSGRKKQS